VLQLLVPVLQLALQLQKLLLAQLMCCCISLGLLPGDLQLCLGLCQVSESLGQLSCQPSVCGPAASDTTQTVWLVN
jgi:hypothetical protein